MMRWRASLAAGAFALALTAGPALADPPSSAARAYAAGNFLAAADIAEAHRSSSSLAFAARALLAECVTTRDSARIERLIVRAENAAETALALDESSVEARLQLAVALGVRGRRASVTEAVREGYARRGRVLIEQALEIAPNDPWAHALMGGWHLEVLRRGGRTGALLYGARLSAGIAAFDRARALAPNDPMIALHYAVALLELDADRYDARARAMLNEVGGLQTRDAFAAHSQRTARRVLAAMDQGGAEAGAELIGASFR